ncbi:MAG TPA: M48 family metallopeptidase [Chitinophagaceae bacterium]|nr:M48 family metallopeptidase [Chitinophagaceae bacterium]
MEIVKKILACLSVLLFVLAGLSQSRPVYSFWQDDSLIKKRYYDQALKKKETLIASLDKGYKKDYKEIYENRFEEIADLLQSSRTITQPEVHQYLQSLVKKIVDANTKLQSLELRIVFSRDWWPNAYSIGEGTIAFNAGLFVYLNNESEVVFVLCHELAHLYLDHSKKRIDKMVMLGNSDSLKRELKKLSKQEYRIGEQLDKLFKTLVFDLRRHSREGEEEADREGMNFFTNTGYTGGGFISAMKVLDKIDDTSLFSPLNIGKVLSFPDYTFRERWIKKESVIFGTLNPEDAGDLSKKERDSLKTHPDCTRRIALLADRAHSIEGKEFLVNESLFTRLKQEFIPEMMEEIYKRGNVGFNLYLALQMLQDEKYKPLAIYAIARDLNRIYTSQKQHELGLIIDSENRRYDEEYNQLLRMLSRLRLSEIADLNLHFCTFYRNEMKEYEGFEDQFKQATQHKTEQQ